jgi:ectoine hydroxylase-related dioxygenase (phytanoyl-CoA dioxygenase family)
MTDFGPALARTENFIGFSPLLAAVLVTGKIRVCAGELLGEEALLYKEKINYKLVGGAGFAPHQDKPAYPFVDKVLSVMVAVDAATLDNGCLQVVDRLHATVLPQDDRGCIEQDLADTLHFHPMELAAGETLFFDALTPHKSASNTSLLPRRALYPTYNAKSEGDLRTAYYEEKLKAFRAPVDEGIVRLSLIQDFEGRPV